MEKLQLFQLLVKQILFQKNEDFINSVQAYADKLVDMDVEEFKTWSDQDIKNVLV